MKETLYELNKVWSKTNVETAKPATKEAVLLFQRQNGLLIPEDLTQFFITLNGTKQTYDDNFFQFYSLSEFKNVEDEFAAWEGVPNYKNIINTLDDYKKCYIFADYNCHLFSYVIRLHEREQNTNDVYVICGDEYRIIAKSFAEFISLYLLNSSLLYF